METNQKLVFRVPTSSKFPVLPILKYLEQMRPKQLAFGGENEYQPQRYQSGIRTIWKVSVWTRKAPTIRPCQIHVKAKATGR